MGKTKDGVPAAAKAKIVSRLAARGAAAPDAAAIPQVKVDSPEAAQVSHSNFVLNGQSSMQSAAGPNAADDAYDEITCVVPKDFLMRGADHATIKIKSGTQELPKWIAEHWFAKAAGVTIYVPKKKKAEAEDEE